MLWAAAIARSVNPSGSRDTGLILITDPFAEKMARNTTVPVIWFFRAASVYVGSGFSSTRALEVTSLPLKILP